MKGSNELADGQGGQMDTSCLFIFSFSLLPLLGFCQTVYDVNWFIFLCFVFLFGSSSSFRAAIYGIYKLPIEEP